MSTMLHSGFFRIFCNFASKHEKFIWWVVKVIFRMGQLIIWHQKWSNMVNKAKKKITFDVKSSIVPYEISLSRLIKWTLTVSKWTKILEKIHCALRNSMVTFRPLKHVLNSLFIQNQSIKVTKEFKQTYPWFNDNWLLLKVWIICEVIYCTGVFKIVIFLSLVLKGPDILDCSVSWKSYMEVQLWPAKKNDIISKAEEVYSFYDY